MSLAPLFAQPAVIQIHALAALAAFVVGLTHRVKAHRNAMIGLFLGALLIAGVFTLAPGRVMHEIVFGD